MSTLLRQAIQGEPLTVHGDGSQTRSFCYVDDMIRGILAVFDSGYVGPVNVGNPAEVSLTELVDTVTSVVGAESPIDHVDPRVDDPTRRRPDISLLRQVTDWQPRVDLREGLSRTAEWLRSSLA